MPLSDATCKTEKRSSSNILHTVRRHVKTHKKDSHGNPLQQSFAMAEILQDQLAGFIASVLAAWFMSFINK